MSIIGSDPRVDLRSDSYLDENTSTPTIVLSKGTLHNLTLRVKKRSTTSPLKSKGTGTPGVYIPRREITSVVLSFRLEYKTYLINSFTVE